MAPQNQPQVDPLEPYLKSVPVDQNTRAQAWDTYYNSANQDEFESRLGKLNIPQTAKAQMWDSKFGGKNLPGAFSPPTPPPTSVVGPTPTPSLWDKARVAMFGDVTHRTIGEETAEQDAAQAAKG